MKRYINIIRLLLLNEIRNREAMIFSLLLPLAILILIGESDKTQVNYVYAGIICIAFGSMALVGVPSQLTNYRENGILKRVKLTELSLGDFLGCVYTAQVVFMIIQAVIITIVAKIVYNLKFDFTHDFLLGMGLQIILGMLALLSIGVVYCCVIQKYQSCFDHWQYCDCNYAFCWKYTVSINWLAKGC
ncbi:ABC transporter permease [Lactiplantibacillus plantarum]|uniref:ABC transporter permease n=1 Tax=Lactiplantibacillus plantarum TaxID=1590 RepID=UPI00214B7BE3|nr:ABC transporter permease [Lactiplantibacillus plantarum]